MMVVAGAWPSSAVNGMVNFMDFLYRSLVGFVKQQEEI
jgi:hypothetical protein